MRKSKRLVISEVSSVDRGAGENVRVVLLKNDQGPMVPQHGTSFTDQLVALIERNRAQSNALAKLLKTIE